MSIFLAASLGLTIIAGVALWSPGALSDRATAEARECTRLLEHYDAIGSIPARGDPARARYVDCYYLLCGIRLDG